MTDIGQRPFVGLRRALEFVVDQEPTGTLTFRSDGEQIVAHCIDGAIVGVRCDRPELDLSCFLERTGALRGERLAAAIRVSESQDCSIANVLMVCNTLAADVLERTRELHATEILLTLATETNACGYFEEAALPSDGWIDLEISAPNVLQLCNDGSAVPSADCNLVETAATAS